MGEIYALLVNKRIDAYVELLTEVGRLTYDVVPENFMVDFEQTMINALGQINPGIPLKGCLSTYRKAFSGKFRN